MSIYNNCICNNYKKYIYKIKLVVFRVGGSLQKFNSDLNN